MQVQGGSATLVASPAAPAARTARGRGLLAAGLAAALVAATLLVLAQPIRSHWWVYDNADPSYAAAGLQLLAGQPVKFLDHPGLPLTELTAASFGVAYLARGWGESRAQHADRLMLHLDDARPVYRGQSIVLYMAALVCAFAILARLLGHWAWGLAGTVLVLGAPALAALSIQVRPDVPLAALILVFAYLVWRAADSRRPGPYVLASAVAGFALMLKLHAAGLVVPLVLLVLVCPPAPDWPRRLRDDASRLLHSRVFQLTSLAAVAVAVASNLERLPADLTPDQARYAIVLPAAVAAFTVGAVLVRRTGAPEVVRRIVDPFFGVVAAAFLAGLAVPILFAVPEGLQALVNIVHGLRGGGVNEGVDAFSVPFSRIFEEDLRVALIAFCLAAIAAVRGLTRRDPVPAIWLAGAAACAAMAQARLGSTHYYIPAFAFSIPGVLWLAANGRRGVAPPLLVWPLVLLLAYPALRDRHATRDEVERLAGIAAPSVSYLSGRLRNGEVAFVPSGWPNADSRFFELVERYTFARPDYPYRFLPAAPDAAAAAEQRGLRFRYFTGPAAFDVGGTQRLAIDGLGEYEVRRLTKTDLAVELLEGPGADRPYDHPEAAYDPETGYFKDPNGRYWDRKGAEVASPAHRRYIERLGLWLDAYGDLWDAHGNLVESRPDLRTAP